jgi:hypothetical protein
LQSFQPATTALRLDRKATRNPQLYIVPYVVNHIKPLKNRQKRSFIYCTEVQFDGEVLRKNGCLNIPGRESCSLSAPFAKVDFWAVQVRADTGTRKRQPLYYGGNLRTLKSGRLKGSSTAEVQKRTEERSGRHKIGQKADVHIDNLIFMPNLNII